MVRNRNAANFDVALFEGDGDGLPALNEEMAGRPGGIVPVHGASSAGLADGSESYPLELLVEERSVSTNTAAAGRQCEPDDDRGESKPMPVMPAARNTPNDRHPRACPGDPRP